MSKKVQTIYEYFKEYSEEMIDKVISDLGPEDKKLLVSNIMHINSSCIAYTNLVSTNTDALITSTKKLWDIMPGEFIAKEAGIQMYKMDFENKLKLFTKNPKVKDLLLKGEKEQ